MSDDIAPGVPIDRLFIGGPLAGHRETVSFGTKVWRHDTGQASMLPDASHGEAGVVTYVADFAVIENGYLHYFRLADDKPADVVKHLVDHYVRGCHANVD